MGGAAPLAGARRHARMGDVAPSNRKIVTNSGLLRLPRHIAAPGRESPKFSLTGRPARAYRKMTWYGPIAVERFP
jgi:hypothetical protein